MEEDIEAQEALVEMPSLAPQTPGNGTTPQTNTANELPQNELAQGVDTLLAQLDGFVSHQRYDLMLETLRFLALLLKNKTVANSLPDNTLERLLDLAQHPKLLPQLDGHVKSEWIDHLFTNHLHGTGQAVLTHCPDRDALTSKKRSLKRFLKQKLPVKRAVKPVWTTWIDLDWSCDEAKLECHRKELLSDLNDTLKDDQSTSKEHILSACMTYFKMLYPYASVALYEGQGTQLNSNQRLALLQGLASLVDVVHPLLMHEPEHPAWELVHVYQYLLRDKVTLFVPADDPLPRPPPSASMLFGYLSACTQSVLAREYRDNTKTLCTLIARVAHLNGCAQEMKTDALALSNTSIMDAPMTTTALLPQLLKDSIPRLNKIRQVYDQGLSQDDEKMWQKQQYFSDESHALISDMFDACVSTLGPPPGELALLLTGSSSRQDRMPHSDVELALLLEPKKDVAPAHMRAYVYVLLSLFEISVVRLKETPDQEAHGSNAGFHLDSSDHVLCVAKSLMGSVDKIFNTKIKSMLQATRAGLHGVEEGFALLMPTLLNTDWGGQALFDRYRLKVSNVLAQAPVPATWTALEKEYVTQASQKTKTNNIMAL